MKRRGCPPAEPALPSHQLLLQVQDAGCKVDCEAWGHGWEERESVGNLRVLGCEGRFVVVTYLRINSAWPPSVLPGLE